MILFHRPNFKEFPEYNVLTHSLTNFHLLSSEVNLLILIKPEIKTSSDLQLFVINCYLTLNFSFVLNLLSNYFQSREHFELLSFFFLIDNHLLSFILASF